MSIEALASYVLDEVALDGDYGTSIPKLFHYVSYFYHNHRQRRFRIVKLSQSGPAVLSNDELKNEEVLDDTHFFPTQVLDLGFRKEIWKRLVTDPEFNVGKNNEGKDLELEEVEAAYQEDNADVAESNGQAEESKSEDVIMEDVAETEGQAEGEEGSKDSTEEEEELMKTKKGKKWRLYASVERRWKALTGHGIDHKKIPPKFFDLLTEIGRHREKGILQPTLTKVTKQDARSVGPRTAALANMGYVEKVNVLAAKLRTSKLTLQSYATLRDLKEKKLRKKAQKEGTKVDKSSANAQWTGDTVDVRKMVEAIFAELRKAKNQVLMHSDIKRKLGMDKSRFHFRAFARIIRRVEKTGCLKRIRVPLKLTRQKKTKSASPGFTDKCLARCIKLIREPNEADWEQTLSVTLKRPSDDVDDENGEGGNDDEDGDKDEDQDDVIDDDAVEKLESAEGDLVEESSRIIPSWVPDRSLENVIYDAVDASGMDGVSSMDLHQIVAGRFYYRPLDQVLRRLGDNPLKSQPSHLLRLAIIRETDIEGRHTHYRYFSYRWHEKLVRAGLGKPVGGPKKAHVKGKKKQEKKQELEEANPPKRVTVATDDLGFSFVDKRRLLTSDGSATLKEAQQKLTTPESAHVLKSKYTIETAEDGKSSVRWTNWNRMPKGQPRASKREDGVALRRGRPPGKRAADDTDEQLPPPPKPKKPKLDENGVPLPLKPRGRPKKPDHLLKNPRKPRKYVLKTAIDPASPKEQTNSTETQEVNESTSPPAIPNVVPGPPTEMAGMESMAALREMEAFISPEDIEMKNASSSAKGETVLENLQHLKSPSVTSKDMEAPADRPIEDNILVISSSHVQSIGQTPAPEGSAVETPAPKRKGRPPKDPNESIVAAPAPKRKGRPPKDPEGPVGETPAPKRKGRPPKDPEESAVEPPPPKRRGRPPRDPEEESVVGAPPKRRGRPPKNKASAKILPPKTKDKNKPDALIDKSATEILQTEAVVATSANEKAVESVDENVELSATTGKACKQQIQLPKTRAAKAKFPKESPAQAPQEEEEPEIVIESVGVELTDAGPIQDNSEELPVTFSTESGTLELSVHLASPEEAIDRGHASGESILPYSVDSVNVDAITTENTLAESILSPSVDAENIAEDAPPGGPYRVPRQSSRFTASVDAMEEAMLLDPFIPDAGPAPKDADSISLSRSNSPEEDTPTLNIPTTSEGTPLPVLRGRMYRNKPATKFRLPRSEPIMVLEEIDDTPKMSYGSAGGMLMIARQRVILELLEENGGVFPGGLEIKHAFESRYKRKNPKAGQPDRRLMVSLVSSLQRSGKINQIVINFINSRGLRQTKRILADSKLPLDHPLIMEMKNNIVAADGNLWFPEGTEIPKEAQKLASSVRGLPTQPGAIESVEFERMYVPQRQVLKAQRAEAARHKRLARIEKAHQFPRFTAEQKELAAKRLEYRRRRAAFNALANRQEYAQQIEEDAWDAPSDIENIEDPPEKSHWWRDLVDRPDVREFNQIINFVPAPPPNSSAVVHPAVGLPEPAIETDFEMGIRNVFEWEALQIFEDGELHTFPGFNMINHFGPAPDTSGATDYYPERASMSNLIYQPDFRKGKGNPFTARNYGPRRKAALRALDMSEGIPQPKRRRIKGPKQKRSRREQAMADLHHGAEVEEDAALEQVPQKSQVVPRKRHLFDPEQDDVLLAAIVIVRTLFGGFDRRIDWALVNTAFPEHEMSTLKARWPRVRDAHKTHLKKLQIDFEEVYLDAYERGEMPEITRGEIGNFDLQWHCTWFKENVTVPDAKSVPSLTKSREAFDALYDLRAEKPSWRDEYHNPALTGAQRTNFMSSHPYEVQMFETRTDTRPNEDAEEDIECIKSLIKANILTDIGVYDARKAFEMLSSYSVEKVDTAFYFLTGNKTLAPKKDAEKLVPGRNYEFTERFHLSLRVPVGGRMWAQAARFEGLMEEEFRSPVASPSAAAGRKGKEKVSEGVLPAMQLSPFMNDGSMMALLNLIAMRRIIIDNSSYVSSVHGLVKGYRTRSMEKAMIDFPMSISPSPTYFPPPIFPPPPPPHPPPPSSSPAPTTTTTTITDSLHFLPTPAPNSPNWKEIPVRLWYDIMGNIVPGMWRKCVVAVLGTIVTRPGICDAEIVRVLWPGLTINEVEVIAGWLVDAGVVERRISGTGSSRGKGRANFVKGRFWWGLVGGGNGVGSGIRGRNAEGNRRDAAEAVEAVEERTGEANRLLPSLQLQQEARAVEIE